MPGQTGGRAGSKARRGKQADNTQKGQCWGEFTGQAGRQWPARHMRDGAGRRATRRAGGRVAHSLEGVDDVHGQLAHGAEPEVDGSAVQSGMGVAGRR